MVIEGMRPIKLESLSYPSASVVHVSAGRKHTAALTEVTSDGTKSDTVIGGKPLHDCQDGRLFHWGSYSDERHWGTKADLLKTPTQVEVKDFRWKVKMAFKNSTRPTTDRWLTNQ